LLPLQAVGQRRPSGERLPRPVEGRARRPALEPPAGAARRSRPLEGTPKTVTSSKEADGWYASSACAEVPAPPLPATGNDAGMACEGEGGGHGWGREGGLHPGRGGSRRESTAASAWRAAAEASAAAPLPSHEGKQPPWGGTAVGWLGTAQQPVKRQRRAFQH